MTLQLYRHPFAAFGECSVTQSSAVIEYLDRFGNAPAMIPAEADAALKSRMLAEVFDSYVAGPMQRIVGEALRPADRQDPDRVEEANAALDKAYRRRLLEHPSVARVVDEARPYRGFFPLGAPDRD